MDLKVKKENVEEAMESCPQAKEVLEKLFPELREGDKYRLLTKGRIKHGDGCFLNTSNDIGVISDIQIAQVSAPDGLKEGYALALSHISGYEWKLIPGLRPRTDYVRGKKLLVLERIR